MGKMRNRAPVIKVDTPEDLQAGLENAKKVLLAGGIIAFPTESFYGLAVNIADEYAIKRLFSVKGRSSDQPILLLIHSIETLGQYVKDIPQIAQQLIQRFWPGGLTLVFQAKENISPLLTTGTGKIGIRLSNHPIATALAKVINRPITGTSANISGQLPCARVDDISNKLGDRIDLILDKGVTTGGKGSTILDVTVDPPVILREGMVGYKELRPYISV